MNKWIALKRAKEKKCMGCGKIYATATGMRFHVRKDKKCWEKITEMVKGDFMD